MNLYGLTGQYLELMNMAEDEDVDIATLADTLEGVEGEIEEKADGYAKIIRSLEGDIETVKAEIDRLTKKKASLENNAERLKANLQESMIAMDKKKFKTELFSFNVQKNAPALDITDEEAIPERFYIEQDPKLDRRAALAYVKENGDQKWGKIKQTESLRIR